MLKKFFAKFRPKRAVDQAVLVLDIGTEFVKVLIFQIEKAHAFVRGYAKLRQNPGNMFAGVITDIAGVSRVAEEAIEIASRMAGFWPQQTVMGIGGELIRGLTTQIKYTRNNPLNRIDLPELNVIVQQTQTRALKKIRAELALEVAAREIDLKFVSSAIIDSQVDGQPATNPIGFQGHEVALTVFNSFAPLVHFGALKTIAAELELDLLTIALEPFALARLFAREYTRSAPAIFLDVGGGTTDLAVNLPNGEIVLRSFAIGGQTFTRRLAQVLRVGYQEAERLKLEYTRNRLPLKQTKIIRSFLQEDSEVWLAGVELALAEIGVKEGKLPSRIFLCGGGANLAELKLALAKPEFKKRLPFGRWPVVSFLMPADLTCFTDETGLVTSVQDLAPLALAQLGWQLAGEEKLLSMVLRQAVRLVRN